MPLITAASITRAAPLNPTTPLSLNDSTYAIVGANGLDPGSVQWDKKVASSPWVHGERPVHQRKRQGRGTLVVRVKGSTTAALMTALGVLLDAFHQFEYQLSVTLDTEVVTWRCYAADSTVGMTDERWQQKNIEVTFIFDRSPVPIAGVL